MDTESGQDRHLGGTVQQVKRKALSKQRVPTPEAASAERYELRDPFAEVTYRAKTYPEMVSQAERLGAIRFHVVEADGKRIPVEKVDGEWKRMNVTELQPGVRSEDQGQRSANPAQASPLPSEPETVAERIEAEAALAARIVRLELALSERYVIKRAPLKIGAVMIGQTEYRYRGDIARVAFTESTSRLSTDNNNPSVARSMVDVSEARRWQTLRVSGHGDFRRMVWLEASLRGMTTVGYEPDQADRETLRKERDSRQMNRIEPADAVRDRGEATTAARQSGRGDGGRKAVLAALEAVLVARRVPARQREAVMSAAAENLAARLKSGEVHRIKVFDKSAPVQRPHERTVREHQRTQDRASPTR